MSDRISTLPDSPRVFEGTETERLVAVSLETVVQDVSLDGDPDAAMQLGGYVLGEDPPPDDAPAFVSLSEGRVDLSNPPYLLGEIDVTEDDGELTLDVALDSELDLLLDPPVEVTLSGTTDDAVEQLEQLVAKIYRTRGRYLEKIDAGVADVGN